MWRHEIQVRCRECGIRRNLTFYHGKKKKLNYVFTTCFNCDYDRTKNYVIQYLKEISEEKL